MFYFSLEDKDIYDFSVIPIKQYARLLHAKLNNNKTHIYKSVQTLINKHIVL